MTIDYLVNEIKPPKNPSETPAQGGWVPVEKRIGTLLPDDYKEFIELYGSGCIDKFLWVFNPFSLNENLNLERQLSIQARVLADLKLYGEVIPYKTFPDKGGILPFGVTENGDVLFWRTEGMPNDWSVVVNDARAPAWNSFELSMTQFLAELLQRKLVCSIFPNDFPGPSAVFEVGA
jgi:hypothetical protein